MRANINVSEEQNDPSLSQFSKLLKCIQKQQGQGGANFGEMDFKQWQNAGGGQLPGQFPGQLPGQFPGQLPPGWNYPGGQQPPPQWARPGEATNNYRYFLCL